MGAGYHGGFGFTKGYEQRNRLGRPVPPMQKSIEMALNPELHAKAIAQKYRINLKGGGKEITIKYNKDLKPGVYGITRKNNPYVIEVGPSAFVSEHELANTIAHELNHSRSFIKGGTAPEQAAYSSGNRLSKYIGGEL